MGNRAFGSDNGIQEPSTALQAEARAACDVLWAELESILLAIHQDDQAKQFPTSGPELSALNRTRDWVGLFYWDDDRWGWRRRSGASSAVFTQDPPQIQVLTGSECGGDAIVRDSALARTKLNSGAVAYGHQEIVPKPPFSVVAGLGVGMPVAKNPELQQKHESKVSLSRPEAAELARIRSQRAYTYRAQSEALRHHSDLLLAIWDPDSLGKPGGTAETVIAALSERIPVVVVRVGYGAEQDATRIAAIHVLEQMQDLRSLEGTRSPHQTPPEIWQQHLKRIVETLLRFPDGHPPVHSDNTPHDVEHSAYHSRIAFAAFREDPPIRPIWTARLWRLFDDIMQYRSASARLRHEKDPTRRQSWELQRSKSWDRIKGRFTLNPTYRAPETKQCGSYEDHYGKARSRAASSGMSGTFGDAHRGGILASYLLAAFAVLCAAIGVALHRDIPAPQALAVAIATAEVCAIGGMFALTLVSRTEDWNAAYTDTRILAEALRMMEFLGPLGVHTPIPRLPHFLRYAGKFPMPDNTWAIWYFRALVRMAPLRLKDNQGFVSLSTARSDILRIAIDSQRAYHSRNAAKQSQLTHDAERLSLGLFVFVLICATLHLVDVATGMHSKVILLLSLLVCVGGPAVISALHGLVSQLDASRLEERSTSLDRLLALRGEALKDLDLDRAPDQSEAVWGLAAEGLATASILMDETADWSLIYRGSEIHAG